METDLIKSLGGPAYIARRLHASSRQVCNWRHRGIPGLLRPAIAELAKEKDVKLPKDFIPRLYDD